MLYFTAHLNSITFILIMGLSALLSQDNKTIGISFSSPSLFLSKSCTLKRKLTNMQIRVTFFA